MDLNLKLRAKFILLELVKRLKQGLEVTLLSFTTIRSSVRT